MQVNGITTPVSNLHQMRNRCEPQESEAAQNQQNIPEQISPDETQSDQAQGVIRNLLDGHYKGVADIRLRINHYEQLKAIENEQLNASVGPEVDELLTAIQESVSQIPEISGTLQIEGSDSPETISGLYTSFSDKINGLVEDYKSDQIASTGQLIDGIKNAFADFIASLKNLVIPQTNEVQPEQNTNGEALSNNEISETQPQENILPELPSDQLLSATDPASPQDIEPPQNTDYPTLINQVEQVFSNQITDLANALTGVQVLPELSQPSGNGKAYNKFLGIYNELWSIQPSVEAGLDILEA